MDGSIVYHPRFLALPGARWRPREGLSIAKASRSLVAGLGADLIHAHTAIPGGQAAAVLARELRIPFICTVHGYDAIWIRSPGPVRDAILRVFREAAKIICVSEAVRQRCLEHDPRPEHFVVIHHGVEVPPLDRRPTQRSDGSQRTILSVGNLIPQKGFVELLQAFSQVHNELPEVDLIIVGTGPDRDRLWRLSSSLGIDNCVHFLGWQPRDAVLNMQEQASVFCLASVDEGFGLVYLEAMSRGTPIIGSEREGIADLVIHGENGWLVPPRSSSAIASALLHLLRDEELRRKLGEAGQQTARSLTWERNARLHLDLYRRVMEEHRAKQAAARFKS